MAAFSSAAKRIALSEPNGRNEDEGRENGAAIEPRVFEA